MNLTNAITVDVGLSFHPDAGDEKSMGDLLDKVFLELVSLGARNVNIVADNKTNEVMIGVGVDRAESDPVWKAVCDIRTAVHAAGAKTVDWPALTLKNVSTGNDAEADHRVALNG